MSVSTDDDMRAHRRKHFAVSITTPNDGMDLFEGEKVLRITQNGRQDVAVVSLAPHEAHELFESLRTTFNFSA